MSVTNVIVSLVIVFIALIIDVVFRERIAALFKRMGSTPLTAKVKGEMVAQRMQWQEALDRLNYLNANLKDLFLYLFRVFAAGCAVFVLAALLYIVATNWTITSDGRAKMLAFAVVMLVAAGCLFVIGMYEANRLSDKNIEASKKKVQGEIDSLNLRLNSPPSVS